MPARQSGSRLCHHLHSRPRSRMEIGAGEKSPGFIEDTACGPMSSDGRPRSSSAGSRRTICISSASPGPTRMAPRAPRRSRAPGFLAALSAATTSTSPPRTLDSAGARIFASFTRGGGMGLPEMTGSPNLTIVPDPVDLPRAAVGARRRLGAVRRIFHQRHAVSFLAAASAAPAARAPGGERHGAVVGLEVEWYLLRVAEDL